MTVKVSFNTSLCFNAFKYPMKKLRMNIKAYMNIFVVDLVVSPLILSKLILKRKLKPKDLYSIEIVIRYGKIF